MPIQRVGEPAKKDSGLRGSMEAAGGAMSMAPNPWVKGIGMAMQLGSQLGAMTEKRDQPTMVAPQQELDMPDYSKALDRREQALDDPYKNIMDARAALDRLAMDEETKMQLRKPLDAALAAQRSIG